MAELVLALSKLEAGQAVFLFIVAIAVFVIVRLIEKSIASDWRTKALHEAQLLEIIEKQALNGKDEKAAKARDKLKNDVYDTVIKGLDGGVVLSSLPSIFPVSLFVLVWVAISLVSTSFNGTIVSYLDILSLAPGLLTLMLIAILIDLALLPIRIKLPSIRSFVNEALYIRKSKRQYRNIKGQFDACKQEVLSAESSLSRYSKSEQDVARRASLKNKIALEMRGLRAFRDSLVDLIESDIKLYELMSEYPNRGTLRLKLQSELGDLIGKRREMALELEDLLDKMEDAEKRN